MGLGAVQEIFSLALSPILQKPQECVASKTALSGSLNTLALTPTLTRLAESSEEDTPLSCQLDGQQGECVMLAVELCSPV